MDKRLLRLLNALAIIAAGGFMAGIAGSASFGSQGLEGLAFGLIYAVNLGIAFWVLFHLLREWRRWREDERAGRKDSGAH